MTDETSRLPDVPAFDGDLPEDDLFAPDSDAVPDENGNAAPEPDVAPAPADGGEPVPAEETPAGTVEETPVAETEETPAEAEEASEQMRVPAFDWNEHDPLDEDELFGQIGMPDAGPSPEDTDLFANDGPDADLPEEGFSESPAVTPTPAALDADDEEPAEAPQPEKKRELSEKDLDVRKKYALQRIGAARVRLCFAILFSLMLLVLETFRVFGFDVTAPLGISRVPGSAAMLDLQLILLVAYCSWRSLYLGLYSLFRKRFRAEVLMIVALCAVVWFDLDAFFRGGNGLTPVALPLAVALTASTWIEMLEWETRYRTVCLLLNRGVKYAALSDGDDDGDRLVLAPVRYVDGYDEISSYREDAGFQLLLAFLSVGVSVGAFLATYLVSGAGIADSFAVAVSVLLLSCPFASLLSRRFWFDAMARAFVDGGTAVIGENAAYRYAHVSTFSVEDGDAFSHEETRIRIVNVFRDSRLDEILRLLSAVYRKLGGPLSRVLAETASANAFTDEAEITEIVQGGVTAKVDGRTLTVGSGEFLAQNGFSLPEVDTDKVLKNDRMCVLFVAYDGEVRARFYIEYVLSRSFEGRAEKLRKLGVTTEIRTFDPCITPAYFSRISYLHDEAVKIRRMTVSDLGCGEVRRAESGLFALGSLSTMLDALHAFRRYTFARGWLGFCKFGQFLVGAALSAFFLIRYPNTPIPVWASALYGLVLILLSVGRAAVSEKRIAEGMRNARKQERK